MLPNPVTEEYKPSLIKNGFLKQLQRNLIWEIVLRINLFMDFSCKMNFQLIIHLYLYSLLYDTHNTTKTTVLELVLQLAQKNQTSI